MINDFARASFCFGLNILLAFLHNPEWATKNGGYQVCPLQVVHKDLKLGTHDNSYCIKASKKIKDHLVYVERETKKAVGNTTNSFSITSLRYYLPD